MSVMTYSVNLRELKTERVNENVVVGSRGGGEERGECRGKGPA